MTTAEVIRETNKRVNARAVRINPVSTQKLFDCMFDYLAEQPTSEVTEFVARGLRQAARRKKVAKK